MEQLTNDKLFRSVRELIEKSRSEVVRNVNTVMTYTYYHIGEMIVNEEQAGSQRAAYTETIVKDLSQALTRNMAKVIRIVTWTISKGSTCYIRNRFRNH
ncbi:hypothetical protein ABID99_002329 [Mucilaginibacter sp. OAE612]